MKLLSIIIPFYNETERDMFPLLSSINTQKGFDFSQIEVILVNDGFSDYTISTDYFSLFENLNIKLIQMEQNSGPGIARQVGLDDSTSKYVMFCDCDDLLHNVGIVSAMLLEMEQYQCEYLSTPWLEELVNNSFFTHEIEQTWLHGKMFLREFLVNNNIRFHQDLRVHEDTYFLKLVTSLTKNRRHLNATSYVWTYSPNSITRKDDAIYGFNSMPEFVFAVIESTKELITLNTSLINEHIVQLVIYIYLITQSNDWQKQENKLYLDKMVHSLSENMQGLWEYWDNSTDELINTSYSIEFAKVSIRDVPCVNLFDWVKGVRNCVR